ncbi:hypothetical protein CHS0354_036432 [Potamilus streckersoni]|uniref:Major facilitator superfamily (MFS) profile domain-containing protein n=1 Tax=Potamilus streckersoni TaxID=2493646 RepID=A0AAE0W365_9BIVA|nr:hypothetical protein CHS0354_036432 [Potamilus streckersoni]
MTAVTSPWKKFVGFLGSCRGSRKLILIIVFIAIFLDNMLLTTVVPIIPNFILEMEELSRAEVLKRGSNSSAGNQTEIISKVVCFNSSLELDTDLENGTSFAAMRYLSTYFIKKYPESMLCRNETMERVIQNSTFLTPEEELQEKYIEYGNANVKAGLMFGSKALVQMIANPFVGPITNRIGYTIPMFVGFIIMSISTVIFAFGQTYAVLFVARTLQGIGSSCSSVAGMGMLAVRYPDDDERGKAMGIALGGLALGVLVGPPFGGVLYQFAGKEAPFLILAALAMFDGALQLFVLQPSYQPESQKGTSLFKLLRDPYILIAAGSITFANMGIAMMEPSLPIWMRKTMHSPEWEQGVAFLPASVSYMIGTNIFGPIAHKIGRWLSTMIGILVIGVCLISIPFCRHVGVLVLPMFGLGFSIGMVDSSMMPHMGYLVDLRHVSVYGNVYAIADVAFAMGFAVGPMLSGSIVKNIGFHWMLWIIGIICIMYSPLMMILRNPPGKEEKMSLIMNEKCPVSYVTYNQTTRSNPVSDDEPMDDY